MNEPRGETATTRVKGLALRSVIATHAEMYGEDKLREQARSIHPWIEEQLALDEPCLGIIPNRWYDTKITNALAAAASSGKSEEEVQHFAERASNHVMRDTVQGLYKLLFDWIATPSRFVKYSSRVWASYFDHGKFEMQAHGERKVEVRISEWQGYNPLVFALTRHVILKMFVQMDCVVVDRGAHIETGQVGLNAFWIVWTEGKAVTSDPILEAPG